MWQADAGVIVVVDVVVVNVGGITVDMRATRFTRFGGGFRWDQAIRRVVRVVVVVVVELGGDAVAVAATVVAVVVGTGVAVSVKVTCRCACSGGAGGC